MLQFPAFMTQYPWSTRTIPTSFLLPSQWPQPQNEELLLAMEESDFEEKNFWVISENCSRYKDRIRVSDGLIRYSCKDIERFLARSDQGRAIQGPLLRLKCNEIRKTNSNLVVIGKMTADNDKEDIEAEDDDADNAEESEAEEFEQETG
ncbi:transcription termination factor 4 [Cucumis melo var. makuwa]|uniref:Transcription termination factor 4 n=1 Tax=Cucumis melo var. makuwa TaxID=1194695 RepID=A0A5D3BHF8_CUCMM|nr:transcription termination factor 4 [Cucumis melo var. makuwa]